MLNISVVGFLPSCFKWRRVQKKNRKMLVLIRRQIPTSKSRWSLYGLNCGPQNHPKSIIILSLALCLSCRLSFHFLFDKKSDKKETYVADLWMRLIRETWHRDLWMRPMDETRERDRFVCRARHAWVVRTRRRPRCQKRLQTETESYKLGCTESLLKTDVEPVHWKLVGGPGSLISCTDQKSSLVQIKQKRGTVSKLCYQNASWACRLRIWAQIVIFFWARSICRFFIYNLCHVTMCLYL